MNLNNRSMNRRSANNQNVDKNSQEYQEQLLSRSRGFFLTIMIFTIINLVLLVLDQGTYFLFSASIPYYLTAISMGLDGWTVGQNATMALVISGVVLAAFLLCWILSAKKPVWLTIGIVLFVLDTAALVYVCLNILASPLDGIVDLLVHALLIWEMSKGVTAAKKLKEMPENAVNKHGYKGTTPDLD